MLVLSRKKGESVVLRCPGGLEIVVTVTAVGLVPRLGFDAPDDVNIVRGELVGKEDDPMLPLDIKDGRVDCPRCKSKMDLGLDNYWECPKCGQRRRATTKELG